MKPTKAMLSLAGLVLLSLMFCTAMPAQQPPDNVEGNWTIYSTSIQNGADGREARSDRAIRQPASRDTSKVPISPVRFKADQRASHPIQYGDSQCSHVLGTG